MDTLPPVVMIAGNAPPVVCGIGDYSRRLSEELNTLGVPVSLRYRGTGTVADLLPRLYQERPTVLHVQYEADSFADDGFALLRFARAARRIGASLVTTFHTLDGPRRWGKAHRLALVAGILGSRDIVVCSVRQQRALARLPGIGAKTYRIPVGSAIPITGKRLARSPGDPLRLVYFGFVWRGRNLETCVRALAAVRGQTPATLTIGGGIKDKSYQDEVLTLAQSLGVKDHVTFTGDLHPPELSALLADADIALLPFATGVSTGRTTFVAALEHGLPVVTMAVPANLVPEFRHGENMLFVAPNNTDGFVHETMRLASDIPLRQHIAANGALLAPYFAWDKIARENAQLPSYRRVFR